MGKREVKRGGGGGRKSCVRDVSGVTVLGTWYCVRAAVRGGQAATVERLEV